MTEVERKLKGTCLVLPFDCNHLGYKYPRNPDQFLLMLQNKNETWSSHLQCVEQTTFATVVTDGVIFARNCTDVLM